MPPFLAELLGTMLLIILGDGVVANVVLAKTKGQNAGWIVITAGWAFGVPVAGYAVGTCLLVLGVLAILTPKNLNPVHGWDAGFGPFLVGILVWAIGLSLGGPTGYAINPARDLGPRLAHALLPVAGKGGSDWGYAWIPVVGPIIGGVIAALLYKTWWPA